MSQSPYKISVGPKGRNGKRRWCVSYYGTPLVAGSCFGHAEAYKEASAAKRVIVREDERRKREAIAMMTAVEIAVREAKKQKFPCPPWARR